MPHAMAFVTRTGMSVGALRAAPHSGGAARSARGAGAQRCAPRPTARRRPTAQRQRRRRAGRREAAPEDPWHADRYRRRRKRRGSSATGYRLRSERAVRVEWPPREPLPEARRAHPRDRSRAGHDRGHRARDRFRARLPRLAAVQRPADPAARRLPRRGWSGSTGPSPWSSASRSSGWPSWPSATTATGARSCGRRLRRRRCSSGSRPGSGARPSASATAASRSRRTWPAP